MHKSTVQYHTKYKFLLKTFILIVIAFASPKLINAQVETENPTSEFIYKGDHFVPGSPWMTIGTGYGQNFSEQEFEPNFMVDMHYQFKDKKQCLGVGYLTSRNQFLSKGDSGLFIPNKYVRHSTNSLHALYGYRHELMHHNFSVFAGPGFHWGYRHAYTDSLGYDYHTRYNEVGLYVKLSYSYKFFYDIGAGISLWGSFCSSYQVVGFSAHIYLSSAFKRKL